MTKKNNFVYRITNKILNKHYYGVRSTEIEPRLDLGFKYFSSSTDKEFMKDQKENPQNFKYKVVMVTETRLEAIKIEIKLHNRFDVGRNKNFYNKAKQSSTGWDTGGIKYTTERKNKLNMSGENNPFFGKSHSEKNKKLFSENNKLQISCPFCKVTGGKSLMLQWHFENCLNHPINSEKNLIERNKVAERKVGKNNPMFGKTGLNNKTAKIYKIFDNLDNLIAWCVGTEITQLLKDLGLPALFRWQFSGYVFIKRAPKRLKKFEGWYITHEQNSK
jgi:hypothetical protein